MGFSLWVTISYLTFAKNVSVNLLSLQAWLDTVSKFVKLLDGNHLVGVGMEGFYGNSTPLLLAQNPNAPYWMTVGNGANPAPYAPICEGQDFMANHDLEVTTQEAGSRLQLLSYIWFTVDLVTFLTLRKLCRVHRSFCYM